MKKTEPEAKTRFETTLLQMREMILSGQLPPGSRVHEIALAERLSVSRTPVRLSLSVLEQEGLVRGEPNRGFTVRQFTIDEVLGAYDVRAVLEGYACRIVAQRGLRPTEQAALEECLQESERLLSVGYFDASAIRQWSDMNGRFHDVMIAASGNASLCSTVNLINQHPLAAPNSIVFRTGNLDQLFVTMRQAHQEHRVIVDALKAQQIGRAEALMAEHIYGSREIVQREIRGKGSDLSELFRNIPVAFGKLA